MRLLAVLFSRLFSDLPLLFICVVLGREDLKNVSLLFFACQHCVILIVVFRFSEAAVYFHEEEKEGLAKICQLALHQKYPKYATDGYEVLYTRPPVIYISAAAKPNLGQYLCQQVCFTVCI